MAAELSADLANEVAARVRLLALALHNDGPDAEPCDWCVEIATLIAGKTRSELAAALAAHPVEEPAAEVEVPDPTPTDDGWSLDPEALRRATVEVTFGEHTYRVLREPFLPTAGAVPGAPK